MAPSTSEGKRRVLVVDGDLAVKELLLVNLRAQGYQTRGAETGGQALEEARGFDPDLVLLDLALVDISAFEVCRRLRSQALPRRPAVIILSDRAEEIDRVVAFEIGAEDFVVKPFSPRELMLRVRARLPNPGPMQGNGRDFGDRKRRWSIGPLDVDADQSLVLVNGHEVPLSPLEMRLLQYLGDMGGMVCSREDLLSRVWQYDVGTPSRTVDTHINRLRQKLGAAGALLQTVRGTGYRLKLGVPRHPAKRG